MIQQRQVNSQTNGFFTGRSEEEKAEVQDDDEDSVFNDISMAVLEQNQIRYLVVSDGQSLYVGNLALADDEALARSNGNNQLNIKRLHNHTDSLRKVALPRDCKLLKLYDDLIDKESSLIAIFECTRR